MYIVFFRLFSVVSQVSEQQTAGGYEDMVNVSAKFSVMAWRSLRRVVSQESWICLLSIFSVYFMINWILFRLVCDWLNYHEIEFKFCSPTKLNTKNLEFNLIGIDKLNPNLTLFYPPYLNILSKLILTTPSSSQTDFLFPSISQCQPYQAKQFELQPSPSRLLPSSH